MSRAALYLHFRNKEDIFASLVANYFEQAAEVMEAELAAASTPTEALRAMDRRDQADQAEDRVQPGRHLVQLPVQNGLDHGAGVHDFHALADERRDAAAQMHADPRQGKGDDAGDDNHQPQIVGDQCEAETGGERINAGGDGGDDKRRQRQLPAGR